MSQPKNLRKISAFPGALRPGGGFLLALLAAVVFSSPVFAQGPTYTPPGGSSGGVVSATSLTSTGTFFLTGEITPTALAADADDYNPTGLATATTLRLDSDTTVHYIRSLAGGAAGRQLFLCNIGVTTILLPDQGDSQAGTTAGNRFDFGGETVPLFADSCLSLMYDSTASRWRMRAYQGAIIPPATYGFRLQANLWDMTANGTTVTAGAGSTHSPFSWSVGGATGAVTTTSVAGYPGAWVQTTGAGTGGLAALLGPNQSFGNNWHITLDATVNYSAVSDGTDTYSTNIGWIDYATGTTDRLVMRYTHSANSGNWQLLCTNNSVTTTTNTSSAVAGATVTRVRIKINPAGTLAEAFVNGASVGTCASNIPTARFVAPAMNIIKSAGTNARTVTVSQYAITGFAPSAR